LSFVIGLLFSKPKDGGSQGSGYKGIRMSYSLCGATSFCCGACSSGFVVDLLAYFAKPCRNRLWEAMASKEVKTPSKEVKSSSKEIKELPKTGTSTTSTTILALGLFALAFASRKLKQK